ncbi:LysM peptidoglycan-binding domain-containing protein [Alicyclobacillus sp. SO9]|uniref:LysM peptidoglycan-binding domain-containing protein n=1 Tax=Alicyclobacillus sp. SO9 TaxID=2665646 RepID=UPI0018E71201|nr:LysM peptidoglycan-binding domain-containing protein [Alicyclobacillus sp. SO9]QQE77021.1 LysM peptidoglycan-binding domain-containing protein [Alicyclobacillus sp. SO9]
MGDSDRSPQIQLEIDQEVFIDSVVDGDIVEDATVATEVTLFDRVGDAYVLEGAIVFAGYTKNPSSAESDTGSENLEEASDALSFGMASNGVNHLHHRLPFILRVPVKAQPRGIVNVNSRISSWQLEVIGAGWIRIIGDLSILGLNGDKGYHFECGAQEEGDLLFHQASSKGPEFYDDAYEVNDPPLDASNPSGANPGMSHPEDERKPYDSPYETPQWQTDAADELQLTRGSEDDMDVTPAYTDAEHDENPDMRHTSDVGDADRVSEARGGQEMAETQVGRPSPEGDESENFSSSELHRLDRLFGAERSPQTEASQQREGYLSDSEEGHPGESSAVYKAFSQEHRHVAEPSLDELQQQPDNDNVVEFDFEHQVPDVGAVQPEETQNEHQASHRNAVSEEAGDGETPEVVLRESDDEAETRAESVSMSSDMWSFVDFDGPDTQYTLRFVIVEDEESLEDLSVRLNCSADELVQMNHLTRDTVVHPGQSLAVPESEQQQEA